MDFRVREDLESIMELLDLSQEEIAEDLGVSRVTVNNWLNGKSVIADGNIKKIYDYAFEKGIRLNRIKEQFHREDHVKESEVLLFHGSKTGIEGHPDINHSKAINDFGKGFYCGESLEQSAMFVATYPESSLYILKFSDKGLKKRTFFVDREWMLNVAYYRGGLREYENTELVKRIIKQNQGIDYISAPIADNRMFEIIDQFINGEITDVQCEHCLSATDLGRQYVFCTKKALDRVTLLEKCFLSDAEKEYYLRSKQENYKINQDKVKLARKQYRNQGEYIEDILNESSR